MNELKLVVENGKLVADSRAGANEHRANRWSCKTIQQAGAYPADNKRSWL